MARAQFLLVNLHFYVQVKNAKAVKEKSCCLGKNKMGNQEETQRSVELAPFIIKTKTSKAKQSTNKKYHCVIGLPGQVTT